MTNEELELLYKKGNEHSHRNGLRACYEAGIRDDKGYAVVQVGERPSVVSPAAPNAPEPGTPYLGTENWRLGRTDNPPAVRPDPNPDSITGTDENRGPDLVDGNQNRNSGDGRNPANPTLQNANNLPDDGTANWPLGNRPTTEQMDRQKDLAKDQRAGNVDGRTPRT